MTSQSLTLERALDLRLVSAIARANRNILAGWSYRGRRLESPDERLVREHGFAVSKGRRGLRIRFRDHTRLAQLIRGRVLSGCALADPVVAVVIDRLGDKPRELAIASFLDRVGQAAVGDAISRCLEPHQVQLDASHGFRRGRGVHTAFERVRSAMQKGFTTVSKQDVKNCFPSMAAENVDRAVGLLGAYLGDDVSGYLCGAFRGVRVLGRAGVRLNDDVLFLGSPLAPLACNLILTFVLDRALNAEFGERVVYVRYADDLLILTRGDRALATAAVTLIEEQLASASIAPCELRLNGKGTPVPVDLGEVDEPVRYLGLGLKGRRIVVSHAVYDQAFSKLIQAKREGGNKRVRSVAHSLMGKLRYARLRPRRNLVDKLVARGLQRESLAPLLSHRVLGPPVDGEGPAHLVVRHRDAVAAHFSAHQLSLPGIG